MTIVIPFFKKNEPEKAASMLVKKAYERWKQEETSVVDDITCVILSLEVP